jgi:transposase
MLIMGCDYHPSVQQIAWVDTETGECGEKQLMHSDGEAERFYRELKQKGVQLRVGIEATGHSRWFERLLAELGFELWVGNAAEIRAARVRKQRNDRRDARHILKLLMEDRFPMIWRPGPENRDVRQLLLHRHRLVGMRTRVMNQLQAVAMNEGLRRKSGLWSKKGRARLESLSLAPWTDRRRQELLELLDRLHPMIEELSAAIEQEAARRAEVQLLMTHPGVGPITALAFVLIIGTPERFHCGRQIGSYLGLIPCEESSADHRRLGHITKQGNALMRFLLVEAAQTVARCEPEWRQHYFHLALRRGRAIAKVALARKLAVRLFWMWRKGQNYQQVKKFGSDTGQLAVPTGVKSITVHLIERPAPCMA